MSEFFLSTRFFTRLPSLEVDTQKQLNTLKEIIDKLVLIDPILSKWYINNPIGKKPPFDYPFPSGKADEYLINSRKADSFQSFSLWNGEDNSNFVAINFDTFDFRMNFEKVFNFDQIINIFKIILNNIQCQYMYLNNDFFTEINVFPHRLVTTSICYVPVRIEENYLPHLYQKVGIDTEYNQGTILVFDKNWADETNDLKKKVQENSIALVELGVIPETELPEGFFES